MNKSVIKVTIIGDSISQGLGKKRAEEAENQQEENRKEKN